ncbi:MAG: hypothetical protein ACUZ8I_02005 [Candidatus Scalindua sp.]
MAKVDKRSRRDKLKDGMVENIEKEIKIVENKITQREQDNDMDKSMLSILRQQIGDIQMMCIQQDETYKAKKPDGQKAT